MGFFEYFAFYCAPVLSFLAKQQYFICVAHSFVIFFQVSGTVARFERGSKIPFSVLEALSLTSCELWSGENKSFVLLVLPMSEYFFIVFTHYCYFNTFVTIISMPTVAVIYKIND